MLDYEAWNITFIDATVTPLNGTPRAEGEIVLIKKSITDANKKPLPELYAETVKVVPHRHIVWYVHPKEGDCFRNLVDFGLSEISSGVQFHIYYYEQNRLSGELLVKQNNHREASLHNVAVAFKNYCEANR